MKSVVEYTRVGFIKHLESQNKYDAIEELALVFKETDICDDIEALIRALKEREEMMSTGIGFGIAIPHAKIRAVKEIAFAIGISQKGIEFESMDGKPVYLIILVAAGERQHKDYLKILSSIMNILKDEGIKNRIIQSKSSEEIITILQNS
jgi:fructose-specific phosphotransferase system IIA component